MSKYSFFTASLLNWHLHNPRPMPWKGEKDPYKIWLSEIILQQTRVKQGMPYYLRFVEAYPTVADLAQAPLDAVLKKWQGLGYYSPSAEFAPNRKGNCSCIWREFSRQSREIVPIKRGGRLRQRLLPLLPLICLFP